MTPLASLLKQSCHYQEVRNLVDDLIDDAKKLSAWAEHKVDFNAPVIVVGSSTRSSLTQRMTPAKVLDRILASLERLRLPV